MIFEDDFRILLPPGRRRINWRRRFSEPLGQGAKTKLVGEDDFRVVLAVGRRRISWRRRYSKTIFGLFGPRGEDELAGEDDFGRRFSAFWPRGKDELAGEDDFRTLWAGGRRRFSWRRRFSKTIFGPFWPGGEDDFRRQFSGRFGRGAKTN